VAAKRAKEGRIKGSSEKYTQKKGGGGGSNGGKVTLTERHLVEGKKQAKNGV